MSLPEATVPSVTEHLADFPLKFMQSEKGKTSSKKFSVKLILLLLLKIVWGNATGVDSGDFLSLKGSHIQDCVFLGACCACVPAGVRLNLEKLPVLSRKCRNFASNVPIYLGLFHYEEGFVMFCSVLSSE